MANAMLQPSTWEPGASIAGGAQLYDRCYHTADEAVRYVGGVVDVLRGSLATSVHQPRMHVTQGDIFLVLPVDQSAYGVFNLRTPSGLVRSLSAERSEWRPLWLKELLQLDAKGEERLAMRSMMIAIAGYRERREFSELSKIFEKIDAKQFSSIVLIGLLRNTFGFRSQMSGWTKFRDDVAVEFRKRKKDVAQSLHGLL